MKLLMYSHDTFGLGHVRRTLLIAEALTKRFSDISILILTGSSMIHSMRIPPSVDYIKLPCLKKHSNAFYLPKYLRNCSLKVKKLRREIIFQSVREFEPDFFIVDKAPIGVMGELIESLFYLKTSKPETRLILGIRDVLDDPDRVVKAWKQNNIYTVLESIYDEIWIYGCRNVTDPVRDYELPPSIAKKVRFFGYLRRQDIVSEPLQVKEKLGYGNRKVVTMTLGGGGDGAKLMDNFLEAMKDMGSSNGIGSVIITGPDIGNGRMPIHIEEKRLPHGLTIIDYTTDILDYMNASDLIVSMAGYNTICEILSLKKKAIVIPRVRPRSEQLIRATRLAEMGVVRMIHPDSLNPEILRKEIDEVLSDSEIRHSDSPDISLTGLEEIEKRFEELATDRSSSIAHGDTASRIDYHPVSEVRSP